MKLIIAALAAFVMAGSPPACNKPVIAPCYKGRLEIKGICGNYTIKVLEGDVAGVQPSWTDENTGKSYTHVFRPANPCALPDTLKEGDSFFFVLDTAAASDCNVCMAYYPAPEKKLSIRVQPENCAGKQ